MLAWVNVLGVKFAAMSFADASLCGFAGNYVMAGSGDVVIYTGEAAHIASRFANGHECLLRAKRHGATHLLVSDHCRLQHDRLDFETIIRREFNPPANDQDRPTLHAAIAAASRLGATSLANSYREELRRAPRLARIYAHRARLRSTYGDQF